MSMLIRSQDKKTIVNMDLVADISFTENPFKVIAGFTHSQSMVLGTYFSEEKTMKVLDEIQKAYSKANCQPSLADYGFVKNAVFQMPQYNEV